MSTRLPAKFAGINLYSRDPVRIFEFYRALGFVVAETAAPDSEYYGAALALDAVPGPVIWIWRLADGDSADCAAHMCFTTDGRLDETYRHITAAGISCSPPAKAPWGGMELLLTDPDGNTLLFL